MLFQSCESGGADNVLDLAGVVYSVFFVNAELHKQLA